jgi:poly(A) polymerase
MSEALGERLLRAPAVGAAREALGPRDDAWVVGGAVRDAALARDVIDVDLAVAEGEREAAQAVAKAAGGHAFELSHEFATWRAVARGNAWHVDVIRARGPIDADLRLRDFTVNAMAIPLAAPDSPPLDPTGGAADLEARVLRAASEVSFEDDPLRVMRAARLAAALGLAVDPGTVELARAAAPRAAQPAGERQFAELRLILTGEDPLAGLALLDELGATAAVLPEIELLKGVVQNPNHHLDVHGHTIEVVARLLDVEAALPEYAGERADEVDAALAEPVGDELDRRGALRLGALLHDVGKPATRDDSRGYVTFIGHDHAGAEIVAAICRRLRTSRRLRAHVQGLTMHHLRLGFMVADRPLAPRQVHGYLRSTEPVTLDVTLLSAADRLAARGGGAVASPEMIAAHLELVREMVPVVLDWDRDGPPAPPIRGDELATELQLEPGPQLGRLLAEVEAAQFAGEVTSREQALTLARGLLEKE